MLLNIAVIFITALLLSLLFKKLGLPELLGMIFTGVLLGPYASSWLKEIYSSLELSGRLGQIVSLTLFSPSGEGWITSGIQAVSGELRTAALIIILIRAGLGINRETLNKIGVEAVKMSFIPCILEGAAITLLLHFGFAMSLVEAGILAFIIAAVSPAVVVPQMLNLKELGYGKNKEVPTLVLAGASVDDVFAITLFSSFLGMAVGRQSNILLSLLKIPFSIILAIIIGLLCGLFLVRFFKKFHMRDTRKVLIFMIVAILFHQLENLFPLASLLGIMTIGFIILERYSELAARLARKFNKIWVFAEIILFVLIGAQVNIGVAFSSGLVGLLIIFTGLTARSSGVFLSLAGSKLNWRERLFCALAYLPKATVQAAIGAIPLQMGVPGGEFILAIAVLSIIITAPLGAVSIKLTAHKLLEREEQADVPG